MPLREIWKRRSNQTSTVITVCLGCGVRAPRTFEYAVRAAQGESLGCPICTSNANTKDGNVVKTPQSIAPIQGRYW